jgi:hypothetical protein
MPGRCYKTEVVFSVRADVEPAMSELLQDWPAALLAGHLLGSAAQPWAAQPTSPPGAAARAVLRMLQVINAIGWQRIFLCMWTSCGAPPLQTSKANGKVCMFQTFMA